MIPTTKKQFLELMSKVQDMTNDELYKCKMHPFDNADDHNGEYEIWLFHRDYYEVIPDNFKIITIFDNERDFIYGLTDKDTRFGMLSFGFRKYVKLDDDSQFEEDFEE